MTTKTLPKPGICKSDMTGRWYFVTSWNKDGTARHKFDITDEMEGLLILERAKCVPDEAVAGDPADTGRDCGDGGGRA